MPPQDTFKRVNDMERRPPSGASLIWGRHKVFVTPHFDRHVTKMSHGDINFDETRSLPLRGALGARE